MALGASLRGFRSAIRPVIAVDGTHLKGKYMGTLFVAAAQDGNKKIYPVAFGVGDSENNASWEWFFEKLRVALALEDFSELSLISDRHKSIERGVSLVFPESYHGHCMHHIKQNMKAKKIDDAVFPIYFKAAKAYRISDFEHLMTQIRAFEGGKAYKYLEDVGFDKWSRAHFPGYRYSILTTNIAESMNAALRDMRGLPITALVEQLRSLIQRWFHERRTKAASITSQLCKKVEKKMTKRNERALRMLVEPKSHIEFYVRDGFGDGEVNFHDKTCTCRKFQMQQLPCVHALAACRFRNVTVHFLCSWYYTNEAIMVAYAEPIYTVSLENQRIASQDRVLLPPDTRRSGGRPRERRIPSAGETMAVRLCGRCVNKCLTKENRCLTKKIHARLKNMNARLKKTDDRLLQNINTRLKKTDDRL
ncbi:uncharacterized protein LOC120000684 [Tripterygium wilfordii]|uniref:uncharacterized protein LOC120000684 n=1 Tax=Tripterygium wilfordii TaxID=458696 RepID=UPI0018F82315|nr:uncharacterized protein LOC120000684 [Tripterygium wilfordii]